MIYWFNHSFDTRKCYLSVHVCVPVGCPQLEPPSTFLKTWNMPNNIHQQSSQDGSEETKPLILANIRS